jgi:hypothetical protein
MSNISGPKPIGPEDRNIYRNDFEKGSDLFKQAMEEYTQTDEIHKKKQLEKVMKETMNAMSEILNNVLHEKGEKYEKKLTDDYQSFMKNSTEDTISSINKDLDNMKKAL